MKLDSTKRDNLNCTYSAFGSVDANHALNHYDRLNWAIDENSFAGVGDVVVAAAAALSDDVVDDPVYSIYSFDAYCVDDGYHADVAVAVVESNVGASYYVVEHNYLPESLHAMRLLLDDFDAAAAAVADACSSYLYCSLML